MYGRHFCVVYFIQSSIVFKASTLLILYVYVCSDIIRIKNRFDPTGYVWLVWEDFFYTQIFKVFTTKIFIFGPLNRVSGSIFKTKFKGSRESEETILSKVPHGAASSDDDGTEDERSSGFAVAYHDASLATKPSDVISAKSIDFELVF